MRAANDLRCKQGDKAAVTITWAVTAMRILLSNDDGVFAPGLAALREAVDDLGEVTVVAPASGQSATGHAITLTEPLTVRRVQLAGANGWPARSVDGRPADCVRLAIKKLLDEPPDLVLSGINAGWNVGVNVFYSGTVAAAAEAAMLGIPAVALSAASSTEDFRPAAKICRWVLGRLLDDGLTGGDLLNVNIPELADRSGSGAAGPLGLQVVPQSTAEIEDFYRLESAQAELDVFRLSDDYRFTAEQENTDVVRLAEGYITVTPLHVDMTNHDRLAAMSRWQWPGAPSC